MHVRPERLVPQDCCRLGTANPVAVEDLAGQIQSPATGILVEVAQNIGQLQRSAERLGNRVGGIARGGATGAIGTTSPV